MKWVKIMVVALSVLVGIVLGGLKLAEHNIRTMDVRPLAGLVGSRLAEVFIVRMPGAASLENDSSLYGTYKNALVVTSTIVDSGLVSQLPRTSREIPSISPQDRLDGWGNPFCLAKIDDRLAAISGGPNTRLGANCEKFSLDLGSFATASTGKIYEHPSGALIFLMAIRSSDFKAGGAASAR